MSNFFLGFVVSLFAFGCSYQNKSDVDLAPSPVSPNRLQMQSMESVPLRKPEMDGSYTTTLSNYIDLARITSPELDNSFGDVQATAVDVKGNRAYVVYNTSGDEVGGAIDILNISDVAHPQILNTYLSKQFEFSSLIVKDSYLYAAGYQKDVGAILMVLSVQGDELTVVNVEKVTGVYATDISLFGNKLLVMTGESGGVTEFEIGLGGALVQRDFISAANGLSLSTNGYFDFYVEGMTQTLLNSRTSLEYAKVFPEITVRPSYVKQVSQSKNKAPTRIKVKNSMLYSFDSVSNKLQIMDISQSGKLNQPVAMNTIGQLNSMGTSNGFDLDQQKVFLAMGEKGVGVGDLVNPKLPQMLGFLAFPSDNGSANNVWSKISASNQKYLFIAYGRQGLRIIAEKPFSGSDKKVVVYAKGDKDLLQNAKYQLKINGQVVKTQEVDEDYKAYVYNHNYSLTSNDVVEVTFINDNEKLNPLEKRNLFVNYLWVNGRYCYQEIINTKGTLNNFGLFENGDSVAYNKGNCETKKSSTNNCSSTQHLENNVCVDNQRTCFILNGAGSQTWTSSGGWGDCIPTSCDSHCSLNNGQCIPNLCSPNSTQSCPITNGTGTKTCNSLGTSYGTCVPTSCNSGFNLVNGVCIPNVCIPNSTKTCMTSDHFNGTQTCSTDGSSWGSCVSNGSCCDNHYLNNGQCVPQVCVPNSTTGCVGTNGTGSKTCNSTGSAYGSCVVNLCNSGYVLVNGVCTVQTCSPNTSTTCSVSNGTGTKTCDSQGTSYGSCSATTCNSGYDKVVTSGNTYTFCSNEYEQCSFKGTAIVQYGKNGYTVEKQITDGTLCSNEVFGDPVIGMVKECKVKGTFSCQLRQCPSGQYDNGTMCVPQLCSPNSTSSCTINNFNGTKTCNSQGSAWGSCVSNGTCVSGCSMSSNQCVEQICTPNSVKSCSVSNGSGSQTCNSNGLSWGSCVPSVCNSGYVLQNGQCVIDPDYCTNGQTKSCSGTNGTGIKTCSNNSWTSSTCVVNACNSGYYLNNGVCVPNLCVPNSTSSCTINNFNGTKTCNPTGSAWGSCISNGTCVSGCSLSGNQCQEQICTPNSTSSCYIVNGTGSKTCTSNGLSYGACTPTSCNSGYILQNGQCVINPDYCSTGQTQSCSINNGSGTKTCSNNSWTSSTCVGNSCNSGYYLSNSQCIPQTCSPNSINSCTINNFNGTKTCDAQGSSWGSCTPTGSCVSGYYLSNGTCVPQTCTPNTSAACSISNGTGSKMCNSTGSAYGSCNVISCNSGHSLVNGQCVSNSCPVSNGSGVLTPTASGYQVNSNLTNDWTTGYSYLIQIVNNSGTQLNDWSVCFEYNYNVGNSGLWNAELSCQYDQKPKWKLEPKSTNKIIYNGSNTTITWNAYPGGVGSNRITNVKLFNNSNASCESSTPIWTSSGHYCKVTSCNSGYTLVGGVCKLNADCD